MSLEPDQVERLRMKLYDKAKREPDFRFYSLYDKVCWIETLERAYRQAKANDVLVVGAATEPKPHHVHRRRGLDQRQPRLGADARRAPIRADSQEPGDVTAQRRPRACSHTRG